MGFRKSVREVHERKQPHYTRSRWPTRNLPRTKPIAAPPVDDGPVELPNADIETGYIRRVHVIAEYVVPACYVSNHFGKSRLPLIQAVGQGDIHWVRQILLKTDTDTNTRSWQGLTALQQACFIKIYSQESRNQEAIVRLLISHGADVNSAPGEICGRTALQAACGAGNEKIVDLLLEKGADVNGDISSSGGKSTLVCAVLSGHLGIVKKLLDLGADIDQPGTEPRGYTALWAAVTLGNLEIFNFLIENGASTQGSTGLPALKTAIEHDHLAIARRLLEKGLDVNSCANGCAPLHSVRSIEMSNLLVTYGARFDIPGSEAGASTALQRAAGRESLDLVTELMRLGSDVHYHGPAKRGQSALQAAASRCEDEVGESVRIMKFLVEEHGADVNEPRSTEKGYTSLEAACDATVLQDEDKRSIVRVKFLVEKGAVITSFTLHVAAAWNRTELLDFLLRNGARVEDISSPINSLIYEKWLGYRKFGLTVIETARINGHMALANILENWLPSTRIEIHPNEGDSACPTV
ncbi:ankyrin repeat-containing domain protein [Alternaria alternata]|nr:ankyrin repeat-containing domain protein [Alternaria alternata]